MEKFVGDMAEGVIECRDQNDALFSPPIVQLSVLRGDYSEDVLTFGGTAPNDSRLIALSVGRYAFSYILTMPGNWEFQARWTDNTGIDTITKTSVCPGLIKVKTNPHQYEDR
jgi:hypothetical protein